jgi:uncharacterized protein (TIGR02118 family)
MIRMSVLYPWNEGARFDWTYYTGTHIPLVAQRLGSALKGGSVEQGVSGDAPGSPPAFIVIAHLDFESMAAFDAAFAPHEAEIMADIQKYTSVEPIVQFSEVMPV